MRVMASLMILLAWTVWAADSRTGPAERSVIVVPRLAHAPKIDGQLDDACWQETAVRGWLFLTSARGKLLGQERKATTLRPKAETTFHLGFDHKRLYVAARCEEPMMEKLVVKCEKRDGPVWGDDCVELFLDVNHDRETYWHIAVSVAGVVYDAHCSHSAGKQDHARNCRIQKATAKGDSHWSVEAAISFASLGAKPPGDGTVWTLNVCRERKPESELSSWADVGRPFHKPTLFGSAVFGDPQAAVRGKLTPRQQELAGAIEKGRARIATAHVAARFEEKRQNAERVVDVLQTMATREGGVSGSDWLRCVHLTEELDWLIATIGRIGTGYHLWGKSIWGTLGPQELPPADSQADLDSLEVVTVRKGYRAAGLVVTNFLDRALEARVLVSDLQTETGADTIPGDAVTVRAAQFVEIRGGALIPDALPRLPESRMLTVPTRSTRLVWLTVRTHGARPGRYHGTLTFKPIRRREPTKVVNLRVTVLPIELDRTVGWFAPWARANTCVHRASVHDQFAHGINTVFLRLSHDQLFPFCDGDGNVTRINTKMLDHVVESARSSSDCPERLRFLFRLGFDAPWFRTLSPRTPGAVSLEFMSPAWRRAFVTYLRMLRDHLAKHDIRPEDLIFYPYDEPVVTPDYDEVELVVDVAKLVREADPRLKVFANPPSLDHLATKHLPRLDGHVDVYCPYRSRWTVPEEIAFYDGQIAKGCEVWGYSIQSKASPPLTMGYRRGHWLMFRRGWTGFSGFWCYDAWIGDMWDDYDADRGYVHDYSVVYRENENVIIPSRRWEAWREGIDDFRSLKLLDRLCTQAEAKRIDVAPQRKLLTDAVDRALDAKEPGAVEHARVAVMVAAAETRAQLLDTSLDALLAPRTVDDFGQHLPVEGTVLIEHFNGELRPPLKWTGQAASYTEGVFPKLGDDDLAAQFNASGTPTSGIAGLVTVPKEGTIELWVKPAVEQLAKSAVLVNFGGGGNSRCALYYHAARRQVRLVVVGSRRSWKLGSTATLPGEQWTHVRASYAQDGIWLYINGKLDAHEAYTTAETKLAIWSLGRVGLYIGCWQRYDRKLRRAVPTAAWNFAGAIDELRVLDHAIRPKRQASLAGVTESQRSKCP